MTDLFAKRVEDTLTTIQQRVEGAEQRSASFEHASYEHARKVGKWAKTTVERDILFSETYAATVEDLHGM